MFEISDFFHQLADNSPTNPFLKYLIVYGIFIAIFLALVVYSVNYADIRTNVNEKIINFIKRIFNRQGD